MGVVKPDISEFLIKDFCGDSSISNDSNQREILSRLETYISGGEDIAMDLRKNNGAVPKYEKFWGVVAEYTDDRIAVDGRRHSSSSEEGDIVVNMAKALSYVDLYRTCVDIASSKDSDIQIPTYQWNLLQF